MKSDNPPIKHHYIPAFYLNRWTTTSGKLIEFTKVHGGKVVSKGKAPEATGFQERLYEIKGYKPEYAQQFEKSYFQPVDTMAADALEMLYRYGHQAPWTSKSRSAWTRFVLSLLLRCPEDMQAFRDWWHEDFGRTYPTVKSNYLVNRRPDDPPTLSDYMISQPKGVKEAYLFQALNSLLEQGDIGARINRMQWRVLETPAFAPLLLTSDRPVLRTNSLNGERSHLALPIGPRMLFIASDDPKFLGDLLQADQAKLVKESNRQVVEGAVRFVYASDERQARFITNRFGLSPQPRLIEQIVGRRRMLDGPLPGYFQDAEPSN